MPPTTALGSARRTAAAPHSGPWWHGSGGRRCLRGRNGVKNPKTMSGEAEGWGKGGAGVFWPPNSPQKNRFFKGFVPKTGGLRELLSRKRYFQTTCPQKAAFLEDFSPKNGILRAFSPKNCHFQKTFPPKRAIFSVYSQKMPYKAFCSQKCHFQRVFPPKSAILKAIFPQNDAFREQFSLKNSVFRAFLPQKCHFQSVSPPKSRILRDLSPKTPPSEGCSQKSPFPEMFFSPKFAILRALFPQNLHFFPKNVRFEKRFS